jgi:hypothetical protein
MEISGRMWHKGKKAGRTHLAFTVNVMSMMLEPLEQCSNGPGRAHHSLLQLHGMCLRMLLFLSVEAWVTLQWQVRGSSRALPGCVIDFVQLCCNCVVRNGCRQSSLHDCAGPTKREGTGAVAALTDSNQGPNRQNPIC